MRTFLGLVVIAALTGCAADSERDGSVIPNPVRSWDSGSEGNGPRNPVPLGQVAPVEGWDVKIVGITELEADALLGSPPPPGYAFFVLELEATRSADFPQPPAFLAPGLLGVSNVERGGASDPVCFGGNSVARPVNPGEVVRHGSCISMPTTDAAAFAADSGAFVVSLGLLDETWFAVR